MKGVPSYDKPRVGAWNLRSEDTRMGLPFKNSFEFLKFQFIGTRNLWNETSE